MMLCQLLMCFKELLHHPLLFRLECLLLLSNISSLFSQAIAVWGLKWVLKFAEAQPKEMRHRKLFVCMAVHICYFSTIHPFLSIHVSLQFWPNYLFNPRNSIFCVDVVNGWPISKKYTRWREQKESHDMFKPTNFFCTDFHLLVWNHVLKPLQSFEWIYSDWVNSKDYTKSLNKYKVTEWMLDHWMDVELLNKYESIELT